MIFVDLFQRRHFYKEKRPRLGGSQDDIILAVKISPAEGPPLFSFFVHFVSDISFTTEMGICKFHSQVFSLPYVSI